MQPSTAAANRKQQPITIEKMGMKNYHRFYLLLEELAGSTDDEAKAAVIGGYTEGRKWHLRDLTDEEYEGLTRQLDERVGYRTRKARSGTLKLVQQLGIDTTDWARVNAFTEDPRIAGKPFARITREEHGALQRKLRAIMRHGGLKAAAETDKKQTTTNEQ